MSAAHPSPAPGEALPLAGWLSRAGAYLVDSVVPGIIWAVAVWQFGETEASTAGSGANVSFSLTGLPFVITALLVLAWGVYNWWFRQGTTGQTIGKSLLGIAVHVAGTREPTGLPRAIGRYFARFLDTCPCFLGLLWPLWDPENRTFSDMIVGTRVHRV